MTTLYQKYPGAQTFTFEELRDTYLDAMACGETEGLTEEEYFKRFFKIQNRKTK